MISRFAISLSVAAAFSGTTGLAQDSDADARFEAPVIVTAPGPARTADELIGNASSIGREEIIERLAASLGETLKGEPGVSSTAFGQAASRPVLRGLGAERVQVLTNGIGVIDASAASPDHQVSADGIDAQRIEILRGPAALAYGGQAIGGVVNVIDGLIVEDLPERAASGSAFGAFNSVNDGSEAGGRGQMVAGPFIATLTGSFRDFDDFDIPGFAESAPVRAAEAEEHDDDEAHEEEEEARGTLPNSFVETETLAGGLSWVGPRAFLGVAIRRQTAEYGLPGSGHVHEEEGEGEAAGADEDDTTGLEGGEEEEGETPFIDLEQTRIDLRGGLDINQGGLTSVIASASIADYEHTEFEAPGEPGTVFENDGVEARLEIGHSFLGFDGAAGLQYTDTELIAVGEEAFVTPTESQAVGLFVHEAREWENGFGVEGGLRLDHVERDNVVEGERDFDLISASFGAHQHLSGGWFLGGQLSYTERAPNESELFANGPHLATRQFEIGNPTLSTESGFNVEATARWQRDGLSFGLNLFHTTFEDFIFLTPGFTTLANGERVNVADDLPVFEFVQRDARFTGGELYGAYQLENGLLGADWAFDAGLDIVEPDLDGPGNLPLIPPLTFTGGGSAEWGPYEIGAEVSVADNQDEPGAGELPTDGYTLVTLRGEVDLSDFGLGRDGTEAFIEARNLTDEEARVSTSVLKDVAPLPGRNVRAGLRVRF